MHSSSITTHKPLSNHSVCLVVMATLTYEVNLDRIPVSLCSVHDLDGHATSKLVCVCTYSVGVIKVNILTLVL